MCSTMEGLQNDAFAEPNHEDSSSRCQSAIEVLKFLANFTKCDHIRIVRSGALEMLITFALVSVFAFLSNVW